MNSEELKALAIRLAALTDVLEERSRQAVSEVCLGSEQLQRAAKGLGQETKRLADEAVSAISTQAREVIQQGLQQSLDQCGMQLQQAAQQATQTSANLRDQSATLLRAQRGLIWRGALGLLVGSVLAVGASGYMAWRSWEVMRQAEHNAAVVRATRSGVLTQCDGTLCVRAGKNAARYDKNGDYILLKE